MSTNYYLVFAILYYLLNNVCSLLFNIDYLLFQCFNVVWMKDTLVCGNSLSPTLSTVVYDEGDSHLGLDLARRFTSRQWSDTISTHVKKMHGA